MAMTLTRSVPSWEGMTTNSVVRGGRSLEWGVYHSWQARERPQLAPLDDSKKDGLV